MKYLEFDFYNSIGTQTHTQILYIYRTRILSACGLFNCIYLSLNSKLRKGWKDLVPSKWPGDSLVWEGLVCYLNRNWLWFQENQDGIYLQLHLHLSLTCSFSSSFPFSFSSYVRLASANFPSLYFSFEGFGLFKASRGRNEELGSSAGANADKLTYWQSFRRSWYFPEC